MLRGELPATTAAPRTAHVRLGTALDSHGADSLPLIYEELDRRMREYRPRRLARSKSSSESRPLASTKATCAS